MNELASASAYYAESFSRAAFPSAIPSYSVIPWHTIIRVLEALPEPDRRNSLERLRFTSAFWTTLFRALHLLVLRSEPDGLALSAASRISILNALYHLFAQSIEPPTLSGEYLTFRFTKDAKPLLSPYFRVGRVLRDGSTEHFRYEIHVSCIIKNLSQCFAPWLAEVKK